MPRVPEEEEQMSGVVANLQGGNPEIFPVHVESMSPLRTDGKRAMTAMAELERLAVVAAC